jgi:hypothetical protein
MKKSFRVEYFKKTKKVLKTLAEENSSAVFLNDYFDERNPVSQPH